MGKREEWHSRVGMLGANFGVILLCGGFETDRERMLGTLLLQWELRYSSSGILPINSMGTSTKSSRIFS